MAELECLEVATIQIEPPRPQLPVFSLAIISPAILELIAQYLTGYDITALYRTCSSAIIAKLSRGVQEITILRSDPIPSGFRSFGTCLRACNHLKSLSLLNPSLFILQRGTGQRYSTICHKRWKRFGFNFPSPLVTSCSLTVMFGQNVHKRLALCPIRR